MLHVCFFFLLLFGAFAAGVYVREIFCLAGSFFFFFLLFSFVGLFPSTMMALLSSLSLCS